MTETDNPNPTNDQTPTPASEADILIGRLVDGEADEQDRADFEQLADSEPRLWRDVALRQQDMFALTDEIDRELAAAVAMELPDYAAQNRGLRWAVAITGWAAVLVVVIIWSFMAGQQGITAPATGARPVVHPPAISGADGLTADEHLALYLQGQFVMGELDPILLETEELPDGWTAYSYLRRIEEYVILPPDHPLPVDDKGRFVTDPAELRAAAGPAAASGGVDQTQ